MPDKRGANLFDKLINLARARPIAFGVFAVAVVGFNLARDLDLWSHLDRAAMTPERFERTMVEKLESSNPRVTTILQLYKEHEPELYREIMKKAAQTYKGGGKEGEIANVVRAQVSNYALQKVKTLSDEGVLQYTDLFAEQLQQMGVEGLDEVCIKLFRGQQLGVLKPSEELMELEHQLVRVLLLDEGEPGDSAGQEKVDAAVDAAIEQLANRHGQEKVAEVFGAISQKDSEPEGTCTVFADYMRILKETSKPQSAEILRTLFASE